MDQSVSSVGEPSSPTADSDRRHLERRSEDRRKLERVSVRGLLAILLACIAIGFAAFALWRAADAGRQLGLIRTQEAELLAENAGLQQRLTALDSHLTSNAARVEELGNLGPRLAELADSLTELRDRTENAERAWTMAEARYLLEIANRRLTLERDWVSALAALEVADLRLQSLRDPSLNAVRRALAAEIQALRGTAQPDIAGIAARLATAEEIAGTLPVLGAIQDNYSPDRSVASSPPGFARAWQVVRSSFAGMISIRRIGEDAVDLVSLEQQNVRRQHLQLLLFAARLAALRGDQASFRASLGSARAWLEEMFDPADARVASLKQELIALEQLPITPQLPDISKSLNLLQNRASRAPGGT